MKVCPFCREEIRDEAIKCRYCGSSLLPPEPGAADTGPPAPGPDQAVYILDQGLIRFAKFAAAVLAIFVTVGLVLYGVDVKQTAKEVESSTKQVQETTKQAQASAKEVEESTKDIRQLQQQAVTTNQEIQQAKEAVAKDRGAIAKEVKGVRDTVNQSQAQMQTLLQQARELVSSISKEKEQADIFFARIVQVAPPGSQPEASSGGKKSAADTSLTVAEVARLYNFPTELNGSGQRIGLIELGGGYRQSDLDTYFKEVGVPTPDVKSISVNHATNSPGGDPYGADAQVEKDIELAGTVAPGASILVYFGPNTFKGFLDAITTAVHDSVNRPSVLAISWGGPEKSWTATALRAVDNALKAAAAREITVVAGAGDGGAADGIQDGQRHVDFPGSSPWVLSCGGTHLTAAGHAIRSEVVWNDGEGRGASGGGVSRVFSLPEWQAEAKVPGAGRGIPDVAANAAPGSGYRLRIQGEWTQIGGTGTAAPLWAGLIALLNQGLGRNVGFINPVLYNKLGPAGVLHNITQGDNSVKGVTGYPAGPGWNAVTGWGSPDGKKLLQALREIGSFR